MRHAPDRIARGTAVPSGRQGRILPLLVVSLLCLATAAGLICFAATLTDARTSANSPAEVAVHAVVDRFYAAVNETLLTGDTAALARVLAPDFVDHAPAPDFAPDQSGLVQTLAALHATFGGEGIVVDQILVRGDEATVRVHLEPAADGDFLGLPLPAEAAFWGSLEVLRIRDGKIAERLSGRAPSLVPEPLWRVPWSALAVGDSPTTMQLSRQSLAPGESTIVGDDAATRLVYVADGTLTATGEAFSYRDGGRRIPRPMLLSDRATPTTGASPAFRDPDQPVDLMRGDLVLIPATGRLAIRNAGDGAAHVIVVTVSPSASTPASLPEANAPTALMVDPTALAAGTEATIAAGRLVLAAGVPLTLPKSPAAVLALVEAGDLDAATLDAAERLSTWRTATAGGRTAIEPGGRAVWTAGADAPAVLFVITIAPAE